MPQNEAFLSGYAAMDTDCNIISRKIGEVILIFVVAFLEKQSYNICRDILYEGLFTT